MRERTLAGKTMIVSGASRGVGLEVGGGAVVEVRGRDANRYALGYRFAAEAGRDLHRELGVLGEDRRDGVVPGGGHD